MNVKARVWLRRSNATDPVDIGECQVAEPIVRHGHTTFTDSRGNIDVGKVGSIEPHDWEKRPDIVPILYLVQSPGE